jgi:tRNA (mo5U34)-methyltransferase
MLTLEDSLRQYADYWHAVGTQEHTPDPELAERLRGAICDQAPTSSDDPRLSGWYHTIELGDGLHSNGRLDLRETVDEHGLPESLEGKTALDVGSASGFWAFELERRGADVTAVDIGDWQEFDMLPWVREVAPSGWTGRSFFLAHAMRGSRVKRRVCDVYDLSPVIGTFDVVFCGSLLMHLQNPLKALVNIRSVTKEKALIKTLLAEDIEVAAPDKPWMSFGNRHPDLSAKQVKPQLGANCVYWHFTTKALREMMEYAGFTRTEALEPVQPTPTEGRCVVVIGFPEAPAEP